MKIHSVSLKGRREQNEDKHDIIININNNDTKKNNVNLFGVYDGHGGKEVSAFLGRNLAKYFMDKRVRYPLSRNHVNGIFDYLQDSLKKNSYSYRSGSTCLLVIHFKNNDGKDYLNVINLGDCRCIICRDNFAMPLTKDHKPNWPEERVRIEQLGGRIVYDGYDWRISDLSVSRSYGDLDATPYVTHKPDIFRYRLDKNDKFFVLGCDGLWDVMSNSEVCNFILLNCYDKSGNMIKDENFNVAKKLAEYAIRKGSTDNITIIVVFLK